MSGMSGMIGMSPQPISVLSLTFAPQAFVVADLGARPWSRIQPRIRPHPFSTRPARRAAHPAMPPSEGPPQSP